MFAIDRIQIEHMGEGCVTDSRAPTLSFSLVSDRAGTKLGRAVVRVGSFEAETHEQTLTLSLPDTPFTEYTAEVTAYDNFGNMASGSVRFMTGRMGTPWKAKWVTDAKHKFPKNASPSPFTFLRKFRVGKPLRRALLTATALGIFELSLNGEKVGKDYFAPGFTSYKHTLQYHCYDVTKELAAENALVAVVGGGWAVGRFTYSSKSRITCKRQAFLSELFLEYEDGTREVIPTDERWRLLEEGSYRFADFYDGEVFDATRRLEDSPARPADLYRPKIRPKLTARFGPAVRAHERLLPLSHFPAANGTEEIYDFGQNFAGVVSLKLRGKRGQKVTVRHAEIVTDGDLNVKSLRTAKATAVYICREGEQEYSPRLTYMGFRYIGIEGIAPEDVEVSALVLHSDFEETGTFACSNDLLNKLQSNIRWSGKSNFVDIPTDCPQRDERMGWTGDISVFAPTACYLFDMSAFLEKWLKDLRAEQGRGGGLPLVVPKQGIAAPVVALACWGDSCILVPWQKYLSDGDKASLARSYPAMKRFLKAVKFWAGFSGFGKRRFIWKGLYQLGDWCAPEGGIMDWMKRGKFIATAYYANSSRIVSDIAAILGEREDAERYSLLSKRISEAYRAVFTDGKGNLKKPFQTGYALPLAFGMVQGKEREKMAENLDELVKEKDYHLSTGFTGTPYLLTALADSGHVGTAYRLLLQDTPPSWLYLVKQGATTTWEEWNIDPRKEGNIPSFNHYAYGCVGDFLYRRLAGVEPLEGGWKRFRVKPVPGGGVTWVKASHRTPYGLVSVAWRKENGRFYLNVKVPVSCTAEIVTPHGAMHTVSSGEYTFEEEEV